MIEREHDTGKTTVVMLICAGWLPPYLCTPRRGLSLGTRIIDLPVGITKALNVSEDASHRGDVLTRNHKRVLCGVVYSHLLFAGLN